MARGRRTPSRLEKRQEYDAAEARERDRKKDAGEEGESTETEAAEPEEAAPKKKKKAAAPKEAKPKRTRTAKVVPQKVVWVVLDNSSKQVGDPFPYPRKGDAADLAARLTAEKKSTYYVQPKKVNLEE